MTDAELYHLLLNAITDAIEAMENQNFGTAKTILVQSQIQAEEAYLRRSDEKTAAKPDEKRAEMLPNQR